MISGAGPEPGLNSSSENRVKAQHKLEPNQEKAELDLENDCRAESSAEQSRAQSRAKQSLI